MSNVLPPDHEKQLRRRFYLRLTMAVSVAALCMGVFTAIALIPSYLSLYYGARAVAPATDQANASTTVTELVTRTRDLIALTHPLAASSTSAVDLMRFAASLRPEGVKLESIGYVHSDANGQVLITGTAQRVDQIEAYRAALVASGKFLQVNVPVDSLAGTTNGRFSVTLKTAL